MIAPSRLSLRRLSSVLSNQVCVAFRLLSDKASSAFCGSSMIIMSAPRPVSTPPTEVASRRPLAIVPKSSTARPLRIEPNKAGTKGSA